MNDLPNPLSVFLPNPLSIFPGWGVRGGFQPMPQPIIQQPTPAPPPPAPKINRSVPNQGLAMNMNVPPQFLSKGLLSMNDIAALLSQNKTMSAPDYYRNFNPGLSMHARYF